MNTSEKGKHFKSALDMNGQTKSQILHSRIHLRDKTNHCYRCGKSFKVKVSLHGYFKRHKERGRPLHCDKCDESFKQKVQLQNHSSTHTKERLYNCQQDKTSFYLFIYLFILRHVQAHAGAKPCHCNHCGKSFTRSDHLSVHLRFQTEDKRYHCDKCANSFRQKAHLQNHLRTHNGEKPYHCKHCKNHLVILLPFQSMYEYTLEQNFTTGITVESRSDNRIVCQSI